MAAPLLARLTIPRARRRVAGYLVAILGTAALTAGLLPFRDDIAPLSKGFGYLVVVVSAAAIGGLGPGIVASVFSFLTFNFFFLPPYNSFVIGRPEDMIVLFVFLGLSILISAALAHASERAEAAEERGAELGALQELSAHLVALGAGSFGYEAVLARAAALFGYDSATLELGDSQDPVDGQISVLSAGGRRLGRLVLRGDRPPPAGAEARVLSAFSDQLALVTERDRLSRAAVEAEVYRETEQVRRSLLAAVSHDLRSPLAAIKASVTDLLDREAEHSAADQHEALESVNQETDRLAAMIANLLDMSRIEGGVLKARLQGVDLAEALEKCLDRTRRRWPALHLALQIADHAAVVRADPLFLDRVGSNLLENAARAASEAGVPNVEIEACRRNGQAFVAIIDHGRGVPAALREQLFYPFYEVGERNPSLGTGLGLAICKGFLALMGGEIWIDETAGGGATFHFSLPAS